MLLEKRTLRPGRDCTLLNSTTICIGSQYGEDKGCVKIAIIQPGIALMPGLCPFPFRKGKSVKEEG